MSNTQPVMIRINLLSSLEKLMNDGDSNGFNGVSIKYKINESKNKNKGNKRKHTKTAPPPPSPKIP